MKFIGLTLFVFAFHLIHSQNIKTVYSENSYQLDELPPGTPMFTYPLLILNNGNTLSVTSYKKQYLKYVYFNNDGKELYSGKIDFVKFPKYSAYIYKFLIQGHNIIAYSIVQEKIENKFHDVMYRYVIDMSNNKLLSEEITSTRSLVKNKYGALTVIPDENNEAVAILNVMRPEKNIYTFDINILNNKNVVVYEKQLEYKNDNFKELLLNIDAIKYVSDKLFFCSLSGTNKDYEKQITLYFLIDLSTKTATFKELDFGEIYSSNCIISNTTDQKNMILNYIIISDIKTNFFTSETNRYYNFYSINLNTDTKQFSEPVSLPIQNLSTWLSKNTKNSEVEKKFLFPINYLMTKVGKQTVMLGNGFEGIIGGDDMNGSRYYANQVVKYSNPSVVGSFVTNSKGLEDGGHYYGNDFSAESNYMFDLISSKSGYYILFEKGIEKSGGQKNDESSSPYNHIFSAIHIDDNGKVITQDLNQNPNNITENVFFVSKSSPILNPPPKDGYNSYYKTNYNRNVISYRLKKPNENSFKYVWLYFE
jgi:hypothetical protein